MSFPKAVVTPYADWMAQNSRDMFAYTPGSRKAKIQRRQLTRCLPGALRKSIPRFSPVS